MNIVYKHETIVLLTMAFLVSFGIMLPHVTLTTYLVDCHRSQSASVTGKYDTNNACVIYQLIVL